jgi:hypothetical protein
LSSESNKPLTLEEFLAREEFRARFEAEKRKVQRHYCTLFRFWRSCATGHCRKARACRGDADSCLKRAVDTIPREAQFQARQKLLEKTPRNIAAPEHAARGHMPNALADGGAAFRARDIPAGWTRTAARPPRPRAKRRRSGVKLTPPARPAQNDFP